MARYSPHPVAFGLIGLGLLAGCSNSGSSPALSQDRINALSAQKGGFEGPEPAINANTRYAAGQLAESQNQPARAIQQYQECLKLDPNHKQAMYRVAVVYTINKQHIQAIESWQRYIKATDESPSALAGLGLCYESAGRFDEAEAMYQKGIAKAPNNSACRTNYGVMLARHDKIDEAVAQLSTVLNPAEVQYNLAVVYELRGMKAQARDRYRQALQLDPNLHEARERLAVVE